MATAYSYKSALKNAAKANWRIEDIKGQFLFLWQSQVICESARPPGGHFHKSLFSQIK